MRDVTIVLSKHEVVLDRMFAEDTWELAFGDNAFENDFTDADVLHKLKDFSKKAFAWDTMWNEHQPNNTDEDTQEDYDLREKMETYLRSCK
tara:strand:- start:20 stop:292 length:273 start_codon:yes stop_codon:yes gene_type:complete